MRTICFGVLSPCLSEKGSGDQSLRFQYRDSTFQYFFPPPSPSSILCPQNLIWVLETTGVKTEREREKKKVGGEKALSLNRAQLKTYFLTHIFNYFTLQDPGVLYYSSTYEHTYYICTYIHTLPHRYYFLCFPFHGMEERRRAFSSTHSIQMSFYPTISFCSFSSTSPFPSLAWRKEMIWRNSNKQ